MSLSPIKRKILENMLLNDKPTKPAQIAKETGNEFPPVMMHVIGLTRMGYTSSPEKGQYAITEEGKKALGIPETSKENAKTILTQTSREKAFHFYADMGKPLNLHAFGLQDFCAKILEVDVNSLEFHIKHDDFKNWFACLGDEELTRKMALLKEKNLHGEDLRQKLHTIIENRCIALSAKS